MNPAPLGTMVVTPVRDSGLATEPCWTDPGILGVVVRDHWIYAEPSQGSYDWSYFDQGISLAQQYGKWLVLSFNGGSVVSGTNAWPPWITAAPYNVPVYTSNLAASTSCPYPWNTNLQTQLQAFITAMGARYNNFGFIRGITCWLGTGKLEMFFVQNATDATNLDTIAGGGAGSGYTLLLNACETIGGYWATAFPNITCYASVGDIYNAGNPSLNNVSFFNSFVPFWQGQSPGLFRMACNELKATFPVTPSPTFPHTGYACTALSNIMYQLLQPTAGLGQTLSSVLTNGFNCNGQSIQCYPADPATDETAPVTFNNSVGAMASPTTWASNGQQTGGSGPYSPGTQSVNYILATFAINGDMINLPAGTFTWSSVTSVNISLTLQGVNPGTPGNSTPEANFSTVITSSSTSSILNLTAPSNGYITLAYILFKQGVQMPGGTTPVTLDRTDMTSGNTALVVSQYCCLVHDCYFDSMGFSGQSMVGMLCIGGVIWQCTFDNSPAQPLGSTGIESAVIKYGPTLSSNAPDAFGGTPTAYGTGDTNAGWAGVAGLNNTYVETCYFLNASTEASNWDSNSRVVVRYCVFQDSPLETHGGTSQYWTRSVECYQCSFKNVNASALNNNGWIGIRSGPMLIHDCSFDIVTGKAPVALAIEQINRSNFGGVGQTVYPANRQTGYGWSLAAQNQQTSQSGAILNGTINVTGLNTSTILVGQQVTGTSGIAAGTLVASIVSPTAITLTVSATGSGNVTLTFTGIPFGFPPFLQSLGNTGGNPGFGYGQQSNPIYLWNNTGTGMPTASNSFVNTYSPDSLGNNLSPQGTILFNQQVSNFSVSAVTSLAATFPGSQNANVLYPGSWKNDLLLCMLSWTTAGTPTVTVTDAPGNTWQQIGSTFVASSGISQAIFAAINKGTTAAFAVTAHFSTAVGTLCLNIADYAGNFISVNELQAITTDGSNQNASTSSGALATGNITTTNNSGGNDLILVWIKSGSIPSGVNAGWNQKAFDATNHFGFYDNVPTTGSAGFLAAPGTFGLTATTTAPWTVSLMSFQSMPFMLNGRDVIFASSPPAGYTTYTYPHPLTGSGSGGVISVTGKSGITGVVNPTLVGQFYPGIFMVDLVYP